TKKSSRGSGERGPWMAQGRATVAGRGPASTVCSSATFRVEYVSSLGGTVRCVSRIGTGRKGKVSRARRLVKGSAPVVGVLRRARDDDERASARSSRLRFSCG